MNGEPGQARRQRDRLVRLLAVGGRLFSVDGITFGEGQAKFPQVEATLIVDARTSTSSRSAALPEKLAAAIPSGPISTALRFAFAGTARRASSATTPLVALTVVFCVLFGALTFGSNLTRLVDKPAEYGDNFDLAIGAMPASYADVIDELLSPTRGCYAPPVPASHGAASRSIRSI